MPVVDVSQHQGVIDFGRMAGEGVAGVILRAVHGLDVDDRAFANYEAARAHFPSEAIGWYPFLNPKRGTGRQCAEALCSTILRATGGEWAPFTMIDAESYARETPQPGSNPVTGAAYAAWVREHEATVAEILPTTNRIGYTNSAFWDPTVGDAALAATFDWIVPRYPVYTILGYLAHPLPEPARWPEWCAYWLSRGRGPLPPAGAGGWAGWQFSAGWNRQGARYGCQSRDLDLNIIRADAWARWTTPAAVPPPTTRPPAQEDDMPAKLIRVFGDAAVLAESGFDAVWGRSAEHIAEKQSTGAWASDPARVVTREYLRTLRLVGDEPVYGPDTPANLPGRTTRADFAPEPASQLSGTVTVAGQLGVQGGW